MKGSVLLACITAAGSRTRLYVAPLSPAMWTLVYAVWQSPVGWTEGVLAAVVEVGVVLGFCTLNQNQTAHIAIALQDSIE